MNYGEILEKSARILWRFKILWIFGLFSSCAGSGAGLGSNFRYSISGAEVTNLPTWLRGPLAWIITLFESLSPPGWILLLVLFLFGLLILPAVGVVGRTGVLRGAWLADSGSEHLAFGDLLRQSLGYFWRVLAVNLLMGVPGLVFVLLGVFSFVLALIPAVSRDTPGPMLLLLCALIPYICLAIPLFMLLGALGELSSVAVIGEGLGVFAAIRRGWEVMKRNLGRVIIVGLVLYVGALIAGWAIGIPAVFFTIPLAGASLVGRSAGLAGAMLLVFAIIYLPLVLIFNSLLQVFLESAWTLAYRRMTVIPEPVTPPPAPPDPGLVIPRPPPLPPADGIS